MSHINKSRIFCKGLACKKWDRKDKKKCSLCKRYLCGRCTYKYKDKIYCPECILKIETVLKDIKDEFFDMLKELNLFK